MEKFRLLIPNVKTDQLYFDDYETAEFQAKTMLQQNYFRFISLFQGSKLITIFIKNGYSAFNFKAFKALEQAGQISDYFILKHENNENFYIKLKTKTK